MIIGYDHDTVAITDLAAYQRNIRAIQSHVGPKVGLIAVVKANAYGHGMEACANAALGAGASMLAVAFTAEGIRLRNMGIEVPVLVMASETFAHIPALIEYNLTVTLTSAAMIDEIERYARKAGKVCHVHVKVDTGMGRIGVAKSDALSLIEAAARSKHVRLDGVFSHFSSAVVADDPFPQKQIASFHDVLDNVKRADINPGVVHMCNSAGLLNYPEAYFDMVRPGIMTYGLEAFPGSIEVLPVEPVLTLKSHITFVKDVPAGFRVSYGGIFVTERPSRLATVPVGYSHGYNRKLSNRGRAIVNGMYVPIAGRICMDQTVFDITDADDTGIGDEIILIGRDGGATVTVEEHAIIGETINYEIVTGIADRVSRIVLPTA